MRFSKLISEFVRYPIVAMREDRLNEAMALIQFNLQNQVEVDFEPKTMARMLMLTKDEQGTHHIGVATDMIDMTQQTEVLAEAVKSADQNPFINMICIEGDMSREGDACTYGSKEHKCMMMSASDNPMCRGHIIYINSGGGAAGTLFDYRDAINYCRANGQNVVAVFADEAASAACFTANMTSRTFAESARSEIGSMGMLAMFPTIADGTVLPNSNAVMHIRYAEQSTHKNLWYREASKGNMKPVDDMLREDLAQTLANTKQDRPSILDDQLTGKMYLASEVMGSLVDEIGGIEDAVNWLMSDYDARQGAPLPAKAEADKPVIDEPVEDDASTTQSSDPTADGGVSAGPSVNTQTSTPMYENITSALGLEQEIAHTEDGVMLNGPLADQLEAHLGNHAAQLAERDAQIAALQQQISDAETAHNAAIEQLNTEHAAAVQALNAEHATAIETINAEHATAIEQANAEHQAAIEALNAEHATAIEVVNAQLAEANNSLAQANATIDENAQRIADLSAEVEHLNDAAHAAPAAGQQPVNNGQQASQPSVVSSASGFRYDPNLSAEENARRRKEALGKP